MPVHKSVTTVICAAALALGLAACGGGGGGSGESKPPVTDDGAIERAVALAEAVQAARNTGTDGSFDDTPYMVVPTVMATHDGTAVTIGVTEAGTPSGGTARVGEFAVREDGPAPIAGWTGARFERGTASEHLVVYADVGAPEAMPFTPENLNELKEVSGLTGETVPSTGLAILNAWLPVIGSTSLAAAPPNGSVTHQAEGTSETAGLEFVGTFAGGPGRYSCSGSACSVTLNDKRMPSAMDGDWVFAPDSAAMVKIPDYDHLYFGWWLDGREDGSYGFQSFADAVGFPQGAGNVTALMEGSATYRGVAAGVWVTMDSSAGRVANADSGEFTAEATLTANFYGALDAGAVNGEIGSFRDMAGKSLDGWRVTLKAAGLTADEASFAGETVGEVGPGSSGTGSWEGRFHGTDGAETNARPSHVTGRFDLHFPGALLAGAFGAGK